RHPVPDALSQWISEAAHRSWRAGAWAGTGPGTRAGRGSAAIRILMRAAVISAAVLFSIAGSVFAQEYVEFKSEQDRFSIVFPAQPKITETTYTSEFKSVLPSRVYSVDQGQSHFKVTVVDYNNIRAIATEKAKSCPPGAETCRGTATDASST